MNLQFSRINAAALPVLAVILNRLAPGGQVRGGEWAGRNPRRVDRKPGSFKVNLRSGRWSDFATGDRGGDPVSLVAYLAGLSQGEAASRLADMLEIKRHA